MPEIAVISTDLELCKTLESCLVEKEIKLSFFQTWKSFFYSPATSLADVVIFDERYESNFKPLHDAWSSIDDDDVYKICVISSDSSPLAIELLNLGCDRTLLDSSDPSIFTALILAVLRRKNSKVSPVIVYGDVCFNTSDMNLKVADTEIRLTRREGQFLEVLLRKPGCMISKEQFVSEIEKNRMTISSSSVDVYIHRLRKKINFQILPICNIKNCGYYLKARPSEFLKSKKFSDRFNPETANNV